MTLVYPYDHGHQLDAEAITLLLGGKAANIATMAVDLALPAPPAFTVTTDACNAYLASGWPDGLDAELRAAMTRLETLVGRRFGDPRDPLLVSVRSGAPRSMPGMMDTILNLGLNDETEAGLARASGDAAFAADCHARFRTIYRDVVGVDAPSDLWEQLRGAVEAVFRSWNSERARAYRAVKRIPESLGTGVTVQAMVFGNLGDSSATGVLFTRNPATSEHELYGDVLFDAQGEDVVAGTHATQPVSALADRLPDVADELRRHAGTLEHHYRDCCDIEFTIERGRLWMLQVRVGKRTPQAALRMAVDMAEDPAFPLTREEAVRRVSAILVDPPTAIVERGETGTPLTRGLGVSPGFVSGEIRLSAAGAVEAADAGRDVILVRPETSPDDIAGMDRARGILTATGGFASHAAVVARGWGKPAVVGAAEVAVGDGVVRIGDRELREGEVISIDGATGDVFAGVAAGVSAVVPEARTLLEWARALGIEIGGRVAERPEPAGAAPSADPATATEPPAGTGAAAGGGGDTDGALRVLLIKGYCAPDALAHALRCDETRAHALIDALVAGGRAEPGAGSFRLTDGGREDAVRLLEADTARWGADAAVAALDEFIALDHRMKEVVTAWQMKDAETLNDHADAAYDAAVLERLAMLHADVAARPPPIPAALPRIGRYTLRLDGAARAAAAGNGKFVASPRVDSYHGAWFELHEDLIRLAGRTRADEVAAGRA